MATTKPPSGNGWYMPQLKIILLGGRNSGKSSVGNLLLGKEEFVTKERTCCSRRVGLVAGRCLTVVDTPGWWCDLSSRDTSALVKREIVSSVSLCTPGPHVFLIVVKASSAFTEQRRRAVEEHVQLLGGAVWDHCLLVLTFDDRWRLTEAEEYVQRAGRALQWLYDKCAHRCQSLVINDDTRVPQLLLKIQKLMTANGNTVFEMPEHVLQRILEDKRRIEESAHCRLRRMKENRTTQRENLRPITELRIVLLGAKGSGKSSVFNTILGNKQDSHGSTRTARSHVGEAVVFGRQVTVVDTPGWWSNYFCDESPMFDKRELVLALSLCPPGPHAFLLVIRVDRAFTENYRRSVEEHIELISEHIWKRVIVLFSFGDWLGGTTTEQYIESEGKPLQWVVDISSNRYHVMNNKTKGDGFQVRELIGKIEEMVAGCGNNWYFEIESSVIRNLEQKMREEKDKAEERRMLKEKQRQTARAHLENLTPLPELKIVLIGGSKTGKSSCGNTILSRDYFETETQTTSCHKKKVNGKSVTVLDTPGSFSVTSDLFRTSSAFLLVANVSAAFKDVHLKVIEEQLEGGGPQIWTKAVVLFCFGDWLGDTTAEQRIESEGRPLQRLVERCGNRYHVLDNKTACKSQVDQLIRLIEEMMAEERLAVFQSGDHMMREVPQQQQQKQQQPEALCKMDSHGCTINGQLWSHDTIGSACAMPSQMTTAPAGQIVPLSEGRRPGLRDRGTFMTCLASLPNGKRRMRWTEAGQMLTVNLPIWLLGDDLHTNMGLHGERPTNSATVLFLPHAQSRTEGNVNPVRTLCHPMLIDRTLRRLTEGGGLQSLIDQWGDSSLEELEAFIDLYFEMVWDRAMETTCEEEAERDSNSHSTEEAEESEEEVLSAINKKLSKLDVLEEIREDLAELKKSLELSVKAIEELRGKPKQD